AQFARTASTSALAAAFFVFELAMWDKTVFVWMISGMGVGALADSPTEIRRRVTLKCSAIAPFVFSLDALPLISYITRRTRSLHFARMRLSTRLFAHDSRRKRALRLAGAYRPHRPSSASRHAHRAILHQRSRGVRRSRHQRHASALGAALTRGARERPASVPMVLRDVPESSGRKPDRCDVPSVGAVR